MKKLDFIYLIPKKQLMNVCGIYSIQRQNTDKYYIGSSKNVYYRIAKHKSDLLNDKHPNLHLQNSIKKYGLDDFIINIIEICSESNLVDMENKWIKTFNCLTNGYNACEVSQDRKNCVSKETRSKISKSLMNNKFIYMYNKENNKVVKKFNSLYDASEYIFENRLTKSNSSHHVRLMLGQVINMKPINLGKGKKAQRLTAYGYKWRAY